MTAVSKFVAISRDNIVQFIKAADFFTRNPALATHQESVKNCLQAYTESTVKKSCGCAQVGNTRLLTPCLEAMLQDLTAMKETNQTAIKDFVTYAAGQSAGDSKTNVTVYYTENNGANPKRYEFIA